MALFELAPPHTHVRWANACYLLCFGCGVGLAAGVTLFLMGMANLLTLTYPTGMLAGL
mgnify:CR=1 FL=1